MKDFVLAIWFRGKELDLPAVPKRMAVNRRRPLPARCGMQGPHGHGGEPLSSCCGATSPPLSPHLWG